jgi:ribosomal protein L16/L10AE
MDIYMGKTVAQIRSCSKKQTYKCIIRSKQLEEVSGMVQPHYSKKHKIYAFCCPNKSKTKRKNHINQERSKGISLLPK